MMAGTFWVTLSTLEASGRVRKCGSLVLAGASNATQLSGGPEGPSSQSTPVGHRHVQRLG